MTGETSARAVDGGTTGDRDGLGRQNGKGCAVQGLEMSGARATVAGLPRPAIRAATDDQQEAGFWQAKTERGGCRGRAETEGEDESLGLFVFFFFLVFWVLICIGILCFDYVGFSFSFLFF